MHGCSCCSEMGLAEPAGTREWMRCDAISETVLKAMQRTNDRQKYVSLTEAPALG